MVPSEQELSIDNKRLARRKATCRKADKKYKKNNPEKVIASHKKWRENNPEKLILIRRKASKKYKENNAEKIIQYNKEHYQKNREKAIQSSKDRYKKDIEKYKWATKKRLYGITECEYFSMIEAQQGCCLVCECSLSYKEFHIDHNHTTGAIRGLLCRNCNWLLGHASDNVKILSNAIEYLNHRS